MDELEREELIQEISKNIDRLDNDRLKWVLEMAIRIQPDYWKTRDQREK